MLQTTLICTQLVPPLPPCSNCGAHRTRLVRLDLLDYRSEYYLMCDECGENSWISYNVLYPDLTLAKEEQWYRQLKLWDAKTRKNYVL